jgi:hypothetical protein
MCGISGVLLANANTPAVGEIYESLNILQHRGQVWFDFDGRLTKKRTPLALSPVDTKEDCSKPKIMVWLEMFLTNSRWKRCTETWELVTVRCAT